MAATGDCLDDRKACLIVGFSTALIVVAFIVGCVVYNANQPAGMLYYISIDSVSGLDAPPSKDLALDPRFNLTLHLASSRPGRHGACMDAGTYVLVSYRCIPLAASPAAQHQLCVDAKEPVNMSVVAKGTGVRLPGYMVDSLMANLRSGVEVFNVMLKQNGGRFLPSCGVLRVGDMAARCEFGHECWL